MYKAIYTKFYVLRVKAKSQSFNSENHLGLSTEIVAGPFDTLGEADTALFDMGAAFLGYPDPDDAPEDLCGCYSEYPAMLFNSSMCNNEDLAKELENKQEYCYLLVTAHIENWAS